jgi:uncharacterized protein (TIGR02646 family)
MRYIAKNAKNEPTSLLKYKAQPNANYNDYREKDDLRQVLWAEQGGLCAYCIQRIQSATLDKMKIEHFKAESQFPDLQLDYFNLLAVCKGNENSNEKSYKCDKSKKDAIIQLNPTNKTMTDTIRFLKNGYIESVNMSYNEELNDILRLNINQLIQIRKAKIDAIDQIIARQCKGKKVSKAILNELLTDWNKVENGCLKEFCQVIIYHLEKKLSYAI